MNRPFWKAVGLTLSLAAQASAASPLTTEQALAAFAIPDDLTVELVAAEPLTASPCAIAFDEHGRLFVAENRGYPRGPGEGEPPAGRIALLEDTDGDGRMDKRTVFADGLDFPNGVMPWKGGVIVTSAPDLLYLRDTDGDGRADERQVWLTGFETAKSTQLRVNQPLLGPDGWIWLASGLSGGKVTNPARPEFGTLDLKTDLRFDPESGKFEAVDGRSQYGHSFDDYGQRFICMNRLQVQHVVMPSSALRRNPNLAFSDTVQNCPELVPNPLMRGGSGAARVFPISSNITTADSHAGTFSAACAVTIWPGGNLPGNYRGVAFSCDPTGNLVHADRLEPNGATFAAVSMFKDKEFLASRDDWFRPVFLGTGPDGALYVCDMYRKVIEHPDYLPQEVRKHTDFEAGKDMGRIWRVARKGARGARANFEKVATISLIARLGSENGWERQTAYRLLLQQKDALNLEELAAALGNCGNPVQIASLLSLLKQRVTLEEADLVVAVKHPSPPLRAMALRLSPAPGAAAMLAQDQDAHVRFQWAIALNASQEGSVEKLAKIALRDGADRWARAAVLSSAAGKEEQLLQQLVQAKGKPDLALVRDLGQILGKQLKGTARASAIERFLSDMGDSPAAIALAAGFADSPGGLPESAALAAVQERAAKIAATPDGSPERLLAIDLLGFSRFEKAGGVLLDVLKSQHPNAQLAAVRAMARLPEEDAARALIDQARWAQFPPAIRAAVLNALGSRTQSIRVLLDAVENKAFPASAIDSLRRQQWARHSDAAIRDRTAKLFAQPAGDHRRAFEEAKASLAMKPHPTNGREVFRKLCASCHRIEREGVAVGPDLFDIRNQPKESILLHIVVPEHEIAPGFAAYVVEMKDGRMLSGVITSETTESIKLRQPGGQEETISRSGIAALTASPFSLMPAGLDKAMTLQELADLVSYLRGEQ